MAGKPRVEVEGRVGKDPEIRVTPSGVTFCTFSVANTPRVFDKKKEEWIDGETTWFECVAFRTIGEAIAETIRKGDAVIVVGALALRSWENKEGVTRTSIEIVVDTVGQVPTVRGRNQGGNRSDDFQW